MSSIEQKEESRGNEDYVSVIKEYKSKIEAELTEICGGILKLLDQKLVPAAATADSKPALLEFSQVSSSRCVGSDLPHRAAASKSQHSSRSVGSDLPHAAIALSPTAVVIVLLRQFV
ncbi:hypothetical protein AB3S75_006082 [Citrus x aurantiifolia]